MWYNNFEYDAEKERGLAFREDNFNPGYFESKLKVGTSRFFIAVSTEDISSLTLEQVEELYTREVYRQNLLAFNSRLTEPFALKLLRATDSFIVKTPSTGESSVIAGYHWFADWGRDTMLR
jgi:predicted glycogen debranching enzyme